MISRASLVPFPYRLNAREEHARKSFAERARLDRQIQTIKDQLRALIQSNFPVLPSSPFLEPAQQQYMRQYFGPQALGQNWQRNALIQELLMKLNKLEQERREVE